MKPTPTLDAMVDTVLAYQPLQPLKVIAGTPDKPLVIGDIEIPCYVLEGETRVLSQQGFLESLGRAGKAKGGQGAQGPGNPTPFLAARNLAPFIPEDLSTSSTPIPFRASLGGPAAYGYPAVLLPQVCEVYLKARDAGALLPSQKHIADRAEILIRALATIGIVALVDEATGYQRVREERALATILEKFIAKELQSWTRTFPYEFYEQIFRLKGWPGPDGANRPSVIGHYTNNFVYARIAPGVLDELRRANPTLPSGWRKNRHHQWFTPSFGHPRLKEHLAAVTALMRASSDWDAFKRSLDLALPRLNTTMPMPMGDDW